MLNDDFKHKMKNLNLPRTKWGDTLLANLFVGLLDLWMSSSDPRWTTELAEMAGNETNDFRSRLASGKLRSWLTEEVESWYSLMDGLPTKPVGCKVKNIKCHLFYFNRLRGFIYLNFFAKNLENLLNTTKLIFKPKGSHKIYQKTQISHPWDFNYCTSMILNNLKLNVLKLWESKVATFILNFDHAQQVAAVKSQFIWD